ncbi:MAG: UDP-2,4-diacetamido-2,4,6-trideoxy-beta-L-altropyranose hydrolase [Polyangiaceae bacterium]
MCAELVVRADAGPTTGVGHVMRCLALAHAFVTSGGPVTFVTACSVASVRRRIAEIARLVDVPAAYPDPRDAECLATVLTASPGARLVVDGYHLDSSYQRRFRDMAGVLLVVDDYAHLPSYSADLIVNPNIDADAARYPPDARLLLGPTYAMLRPEFAPFIGRARPTAARVRKVLVTFGGGDTTDVTRIACEALAALGDVDLHARVVVGAESTALTKIARASTTRIELMGPTDEMPALMAWADMAVCAGGVTCWELALLGVPAVAVCLADNQRGNVNGLARAGVIRSVGDVDALTSESLASALRDLMDGVLEREEMGRRGRELIDGRGAERVARALLGARREGESHE